MSTTRDQQMQIKCHALAFLFSQGVTAANDLAERLNVPHEFVRRWAKRPEFHTALDTLGYQGDRQFTRRRRDVKRENPVAYAAATKLYQQLADQGVPARKRIREIATILENKYSLQRINSWIKRDRKEKNK